MRAGKLRHLLDVVAPVVARQSDGGFENRPLVVQRVWGNVEPFNAGSEVVAAAAVEANATHLVTIRWMQGLTTKHQLHWESRTLGIVAIDDPTGRRRELRLLCREVVT